IASLPELSADSREAENHPLPPGTFSTIVRATHNRSILIGAHDLAPGSGRESLIDPLGRRHGEEACRRVVRDVPRLTIGWIVRPSVDRILEETDRAVSEGEVAAAGVEARGGDRKVVFLVVVTVKGIAVGVGVVADPAPRVHRKDRAEKRVAENTRDPGPVVFKVNGIINVRNLAELAVGFLSEGEGVAQPVGDRGESRGTDGAGIERVGRIGFHWWIDRRPAYIEEQTIGLVEHGLVLGRKVEFLKYRYLAKIAHASRVTGVGQDLGGSIE